MGAQYLMAVSPLLFVAGAQAFDKLAGGRRWGSALILALIAYQAAYGGWTTRVEVHTAAAKRPPAALDSGSPILLDSVARGVLPTVLWHVQGSTPVYAAMQDDLLGSFPEIPADVQACGVRERSALRERRRQATARAGSARYAGLPLRWRAAGVSSGWERFSR